MEDKKRVGVGFGVMILKGNKILLGLRNEDPDKADTAFHEEGTWTMPGGKLNYGESFEHGGIREVKEETNLDVEEIVVKFVQNDLNEHAHFVTIGMIATKYKGKVKTMEPDEIVKWEWFSLDDLPSKIYFPSRKCIEKYKLGLFYQED